MRTRGSFKYGNSHTRDMGLYTIWCGIKTRCYNEKAANYKYYGAKGVKMCKEWKNNFETFNQWCIDNKYTKGLTIDRFPNKDGDYSPSNCRLVSMLEQANNRRNRTALTYNGKTQSIKEWSEELNISRSQVKKLMNYKP